jgi:hypothetical protein
MSPCMNVSTLGSYRPLRAVIVYLKGEPDTSWHVELGE